MFAKIVEELVIYQIALELAKEVNKLVKQIPHYWDIEECRQILRSSSSVPSNIKEGFAQRFYAKQFIKYLYIAMASSDESQDHLAKLKNNGYVKSEIADGYIKRYKNLSVRILNFINYLRKKYNIKTLP
jgi:four helix bundle protein